MPRPRKPPDDGPFSWITRPDGDKHVDLLIEKLGLHEENHQSNDAQVAPTQAAAPQHQKQENGVTWAAASKGGAIFAGIGLAYLLLMTLLGGRPITQRDLIACVIVFVIGTAINKYYKSAS